MYPTPEQFGEISKLMKDKGMTRDEAALIIMGVNYKPSKRTLELIKSFANKMRWLAGDLLSKPAPHAKTPASTRWFKGSYVHS